MEIRTPRGNATVRGSFATIEVLSNDDVGFWLLQGLGRFVLTGATPTDSCARLDPCRNFRSRMGASIRDNQFADFTVPLEALEDYCNNMLESCKPLANALGINVAVIYLTHDPKESGN